MSNPVSNYSGSSDSTAFLEHYKKEVIKSDPRLEFHQDIIKDFGESYERAYQILNTFYAESYRDVSSFLGNQWSLEEMAYLSNQRRSCFTYNKQMALVNLVDGHQRKNRHSTIVTPIENSSEETAQILSDGMQYVMQHAKGYEAISDAFRSCLISGLSFLSAYMDYRDDPVSGDVRFHKDDWNAVIFDPFTTNIRSLHDCSFLARRKFMSRTDIISLIPDKEDVIRALPWASTQDDKFTYMPYARSWGTQKLLNYTEYWRTKWVPKNVLVDMATGETMEYKGDKRRIKYLKQFIPGLEIVKKPVRMVERAIIVQGELLSYEENPDGLDEYGFVGFPCVWEPSYDLWTWKLQSLCRVNRDSQAEFNKRRSKLIDLVDSQLSSGWIAKTNSVSNPTSLYKSGQGQVIFLKPDAQMTDVVRIEAPNVPPSFFQMEEGFKQDFFESLGLSRENIGAAEQDDVQTAGILAKMRADAGWLPMTHIFDGLRQSQELLGQKTMKLMQLNYTPEKIKLITKRDPTPEFYSKEFARYDIVVEEGVLTDTQRQSQFVQMNALRAMGVQFSDEEIVDASNLHDKKQYKERLAAQQKAQAETEQMQVHLAMEQQKVLTESAESKAFSDRSLGEERLAKIELDKALNAERISRAEEERTAAVLELVKAAKEIEGMDLSSLMQKIEILKAISIPDENVEKTKE